MIYKYGSWIIENGMTLLIKKTAIQEGIGCKIKLYNWLYSLLRDEIRKHKEQLASLLYGNNSTSDLIGPDFLLLYGYNNTRALIAC